MAEREEYYIGINGNGIPVNKEIYEAYYKGKRKERYFTHDLKSDRTVIDKATGQKTVILSREISYELIGEMEKQLVSSAEAVEDATIRAVLLEKLKGALHNLNTHEMAIISALFWQEISEVELAKQLGIARTTLQSRKYKILDKLKKVL